MERRPMEGKRAAAEFAKAKAAMTTAVNCILWCLVRMKDLVINVGWLEVVLNGAVEG